MSPWPWCHLYLLPLFRGNGAVLSRQNGVKTGSGAVRLKAGNATLVVLGDGEEGVLGDLLEPGSVTRAAAKSGAGSAGVV